MTRWEPDAEKRLRTAAIELFLERGYENVTVAQIGLKRGDCDSEIVTSADLTKVLNSPYP